MALASQGNGYAAFLHGAGGRGPGSRGRLLRWAAKNATDLEQRQVIALMAEVMAEGIEQARQKAGPQHIHVAAEGIGQRRERPSGHEPCSRVRDERLPLGFVQAKPGQNAPGFG